MRLQSNPIIQLSHVNYISYFSIALLSFFITDHLIFILLTLTCIFSFLLQFRNDKKEIERALNYTRVPRTFWKRFGQLSSFTTFFFALDLFLVYLELQSPKVIGKMYFCFCTVVLIFESEHKNYIHSLRSFDGGLKLPGRSSNLIPWYTIQNMEVSERIFVLSLQNGLRSFHIDQRDLQEAAKIIDTFSRSNLKQRDVKTDKK